MKKITFILLAVCQFSASSQTYNIAISNAIFNSVQNQISSVATTTLALQKGREVAETNCFTSAQAKNIVLLFLQDVRKTEIAKVIYPNVIDKRNFLTVYEIYTNAPALASLARLVSEYDMQQNQGTNAGFDRFKTVIPDYEKYTGIKIVTQQPLNNNVFARFISAIDNPDPQIRLRNALATDPAKYFSVAQVMEIAMLFQSEYMRLNVLQHYVAQMVDTYNYPFALQLLSSLSNKNSYQQSVYFYLRNNSSGINPSNGTSSCRNVITDAEAVIIKNSLEKIKLSATKTKQF